MVIKDRAVNKKGEEHMSKNDKEKLELLDTRLDEKTTKTMIICSVIMLVAVLIHDGDHIRQAYNWGYTIPMSLWALNLIVYVLPVVSIFLAKSRRMSATIVCCLAGIVTSLSFVVLHCFGSSSGLNWGIWNFTYFELIEGVWYDPGTGMQFYQGVDTLSWILLFHVPVFCLPCSVISLKKFFDIKKARKPSQQ